MRKIKQFVTFLITVEIAMGVSSAQPFQTNTKEKDKNMN